MENPKVIVIIKREIVNKDNPSTVNIPVEFRRNFLSLNSNPELLERGVVTFRIILKIIANLRSETFSSIKDERNLKAFSMFEKDFKTENNTYAKFSFSSKEIDPHKNASIVKESLEFLVNYKLGWYKGKNEKGKIIQSYGGLLTNVSVTNGKITFLISAYWLEKLCKMDHYNTSHYQYFFNVRNTKHILFFLWFLELGGVTKTSFKKLNETYDLHYKTAKDLKRFFLMPIKKEFEKFTAMSMTVKIKREFLIISKNNSLEKIIN